MCVCLCVCACVCVYATAYLPISVCMNIFVSTNANLYICPPINKTCIDRYLNRYTVKKKGNWRYTKK